MWFEKELTYIKTATCSDQVNSGSLYFSCNIAFSERMVYLYMHIKGKFPITSTPLANITFFSLYIEYFFTVVVLKAMFWSTNLCALENVLVSRKPRKVIPTKKNDCAVFEPWSISLCLCRLFYLFFS